MARSRQVRKYIGSYRYALRRTTHYINIGQKVYKKINGKSTPDVPETSKHQLNPGVPSLNMLTDSGEGGGW